MAGIDWPDGVPTLFLEEGFSFRIPERTISSQTDSGKTRSRKVFTAAPYGFGGNLRMLQAQMLTFVDWRDAIGGAVFNWAHPLTGDAVEARFVPGQQGNPVKHPKSKRFWLVPAVIEIEV